MRNLAFALFAILLVVMTVAASSMPASAGHYARSHEYDRMYPTSELYRMHRVHRARRPPPQIPRWPCDPGPRGEYCRKWYSQHPPGGR